MPAARKMAARFTRRPPSKGARAVGWAQRQNLHLDPWQKRMVRQVMDAPGPLAVTAPRVHPGLVTRVLTGRAGYTPPPPIFDEVRW